MHRLRRSSALRLWVLALYALATISLGMAHHAGATVAPAATDLAAYALPDGSLPLLCLDDESSGDERAATGTICDACLLSAAPGLAVTPPVLVKLPPRADTFAAVAESAAPDGTCRSAHRSRAPPVTLA